MIDTPVAATNPTDRAASAGPDAAAPLSVAVLIDLEWGPAAGGHVRSWERLAAASDVPGLALTLFAEGKGGATRRIGPRAELVLLPPVLSTRRLGLAGAVADHTDLAPYHPKLAKRLKRFDVLHTSDAYFAYAATARAVARRTGAVLTTSIHTATPDYTELYAGRILHRRLGGGALARWVVEDLGAPRRLAERMRRKLARHIACCDHVFLSARDQAAELPPDAPPATLLRRGINRDLFNPDKRDRAWLAAQYGIPETRDLLAFVGRIDPGKSVMTLAQAARRLIDQGRDLHVILAGQGPSQAEIAALLGDRAVMPGVLAAETLARVYASADLFVFPSRIEQSPNVVLEAKACGLPVLVAPSGGGVHVRQDGEDGIVIADEAPEAWSDSIAALLDDRARLHAIGAAARRDVETNHPSWGEVVAEDLMPHWRAAVARRRA